MFDEDETVLLTLTATAGYSVGTPGTATVTIADNDVPTVTVVATDGAASETGLDAGTFTISRTGVATAALDVAYSVGGTTSAADYTPALSGTVTIPAGQAATTVTITPTTDTLVEGPETIVLTLTASAAYSLGAPGTETATVTIADAPPITLALVGTSVVGVGLNATLQVTLGAPAPAGGVVVTVTSDNTGLVAVAAPGTTRVPAGASTGQVTLNGVSPGTTTVRANATGYTEGTLSVLATLNLIATPTTLNVPLAQSASLPITITRDVGNTGDVLVSIVSNNPAAVSVTTPTVTVPAGQSSANATVSGQGVGSATLTATASGFVSDTTIATTTATLNITVATLTFNSAFGGGSLTIQLESPPGTIVAAPAGGVAIGLTTTDATCVAVPGTVTIAQGTTSAVAPVTYGGSATLPCSATIAASGPIGFTGDTASVTVNPASGITVAGTTVGGGLQQSGSGNLGASDHGGVTVHVESSDSSHVLVAPNATTAGAASLDIFVANGQTGFSFFLQGTDWVNGVSSAAGVTITASAPGFSNGSSTVNYVQPALRLSFVPATTTTLSPNTDFTVEVGIPAAGNGNLSTPQFRRAGGGNLTVTVTNSNALVAEIDPNGGGAGAQVATASIVAGQLQTPNGTAGGLEFDPLAAGTTTVSASIPGFIVTTAGVQNVTVSQ